LPICPAATEDRRTAVPPSKTLIAVIFAPPLPPLPLPLWPLALLRPLALPPLASPLTPDGSRSLTRAVPENIRT
jgi:hypothetical protein